METQALGGALTFLSLSVLWLVRIELMAKVTTRATRMAHILAIDDIHHGIPQYLHWFDLVKGKGVFSIADILNLSKWTVHSVYPEISTAFYERFE